MRAKDEEKTHREVNMTEENTAYWFTVEARPDKFLTREEVRQGLDNSDVNVILLGREDEVHLVIKVVNE